MITSAAMLKRWTGVTLVVLGLGAGPFIGFAQTEKAAKKSVLTEQDLEKIKRRLDQLTENHQKLAKAIEEIKAELAIVKIRVTD